MGLVFVILIVLIFGGGGGGYYTHSRYGTAGLVAVLIPVLIVCLLLGAIGPRYYY